LPESEAPREAARFRPATARDAIQTLVTITFEARDGKTIQTFHQRPFLNVESRDSHVGGWTEAFDKLEAYAAKIVKEHTE
jgi:uncharacterized protein YndB with AHSA1/START domain